MKNFTRTETGRLHKLFYFLLIAIMISSRGFSQNVAINSTGGAPNPSAGLDVDFPDKGLLIPRVSLTATASFAPLSAHVAGMIVYNIATVGDVVPGFYYNDGVKWVTWFLAGNAIGNMLYWNGTAWMLVPAGLPGQFLQVSGAKVPAWAGAASATIFTAAASSITGTSATSGGNITSDGGSSVLSRGVCWDILTGPTIANTKTTDGLGSGTFVSSITGLLPVTTYYVRAYAMNSNTISYGDEITLKTLPVLPTLAPTTPATLITGSTATCRGNVTATGGAPIIERGICYATTQTPTTANSKVIDPIPGTGIFTCNMSGLLSTTTYYVRPYAINSAGTVYGNEVTFKTYPVLTTSGVSLITGESASTGGILIAAGGTANIWNYGIAYSTISGDPTPALVQSGSSPSASPLTYTTNLTGLLSSTKYYIRAYATGLGPYTVYGQELNFTTNTSSVPVVASTAAITGLSATTANSGGTITTDGGSAITARGVCWSTGSTPILGAGNFTSDGTGTAPFVSNITGLTGGTTYYVRAYATNSVGTSYGPVDVSFTTWVQAPYTIGQDLGYGYCAYVDETGGGFIVSYDIPNTDPWGCSGTNVVTGSAIGTGLANTYAIIAACASRPIAASVAKSYSGGGFHDWYLPSSGEWAQILNVANLVGLNNHATNNFYTSTQQSTTYAITAFFNYNSGSMSGAQKAPVINDYINSLRAIRSFGSTVPPTVTTDAITNGTDISATSGGNVSSDGGSSVTERGVCWSTTTSPTTDDTFTSDGSGTGTFTSSITGLTTGVTYYIRAYATNSLGTAYGNEVIYIPAVAGFASVITDPVVNLIGALAEGGGTVLSDGGNAVSAFGLCWSTNPGPTITTNMGMTTDVTNISGTFVTISGLTIGTSYYVRAYATNSAGTAYGDDVSFDATAAYVGQVITGGAMFGTVFSIDGTGLHGLIADPWGFGTADWGCPGTITGASGTTVGTGMANTNSILAGIVLNSCLSSTGAFAPQYAKYDGTDWYIPSKDELDLLWSGRISAGLTLSFPLWSSSEADAANAWYFDGTIWHNTGLKSDLYNVYPIRSF
jgi:hypothetical protein